MESKITPVDETYAKLDKHNVIIMRSNGYINATSLCKIYGKKFFHWKENSSTENLCSVLEKELNLKRDEFIITVMFGKKFFKGSYVHPKLIIPIAAWTSPDLVLPLCDIIVEFNTMEKTTIIRNQ